LQPAVVLPGSLVPFATASDLLRQVSGLHFSAATCRRRTESVGAELHEQHVRRQAVSPAAPPRWDLTLPDRDGQGFPGTVAYVGLDAFAVPTRGDGEVDWKMLYVGLLYDPRKDHTLYLVDYDFEPLAGLLRQYAIALGLGRAETLVALTDGGNGLERVLRQGLSDAVAAVLDWWHLSEKVHELGGQLHESDARAAKAWAKARETTLWEQGGQAPAEELDRLGCPSAASAVGDPAWLSKAGATPGPAGQGRAAPNTHEDSGGPAPRSKAAEPGNKPRPVPIRIRSRSRGRSKNGGLISTKGEAS
jgi:hypothetical protein